MHLKLFDNTIILDKLNRTQVPLVKGVGNRMTKDELIKILDTLTDAQIEYLFHLSQILFCQTAD